MKKIFVLLVIFVQTCLFVYASNVTFLKEEYELQYVKKGKLSTINEYVRPSQNLNNWTNIITVHHFPKIIKAENYIASYMDMFKRNKSMYPIIYAPKQNLISFGIIAPQDKQKGYIEYNILRCENTEDGAKCIQFGHKYKFKDEEGFKSAYERSKKYNMKYYNALVATQIPVIEAKNYEKKIEK